MREILFRGKLLAGTSAVEWVYGNLVVRPGQNVAIITPDDTPIGKYGRVDPDTVGQYTGLTDKNGVRIFEGDILHDAETALPFKIVYREGSFWGDSLNPEWDGEELGTLYRGFGPLEVIGNIHDNPDLTA